jgi:hypothetical protein
LAFGSADFWELHKSFYKISTQVVLITFFVLLSFLRLKNRERSKMLEAENMRQTSVYFTHSMKAEIKQLAKKRGWSQGLMIREIVKDYLDSQKSA